jgi:acetyl esterase
VTIDPQAQKLLDLIAESGAPPLTQQTPEEARQGPRLFAEMMGKGPEVASVRDIEIPGPAGAIPARVYEPVPDPPGTVVYYHGGGWVIGGLDEWDAAMRIVANASGARIVHVDYRLAPEHPFPAAVEDAVAGAAWVARELAGGQPIVVAGDSAGGNLATVVARKARDEGGPAISLQVLIYPAVDTDPDRPYYAQYRETKYILNAPEMAWFFNHYVPNPADRSNPDVAPLRAESLEGLPPAYIVLAGLDPLLEEGEEYAKRLEDSGVRVTTVRHDDQIHAFFTLPNLIEAGNRALEECGAFIKETLAVRA